MFITAVAPIAVVPLLMIGLAFLCYEGVEKLFHKTIDATEAKRDNELLIEDPAELEARRIKGAVLTDFILSAEILIIALGTSAGASFPVQAFTLLAIGVGMTVVVYGSVALVVKADDVGLQMLSSHRKIVRFFGRLIIWASPKFMRLLSVAGMAAMFLVGGEILAHGIDAVEHAIEAITQEAASRMPYISGLIQVLIKYLSVGLFGVLSGFMVLLTKKGLFGFLKLRKR